MGIVVLGLSHKTAPIELREHLTIPSEQVRPALDHLRASGHLCESVILSTCNRLEIYGRPTISRSEGLKHILSFIQTLYSHPQLEKAIYTHEGEAAVHHLFRVAAGLDSMVVGETEVLGQVKSAYGLAHQHCSTGKITNVLFQRALYVGKQVRQTTRLSEGMSSVGSVAVHLAEKIFGALEQRRVLIVGAGKMAETTARHLLSQKIGQLVILNRTHSKAVELAKLFNGVAKPMDDLETELQKADIVICSTAAEVPFIGASLVESIMNVRRQRLLYFIDIGVPRNVDPQVHQLDNVFVYNIDDLNSLVEENLSQRKKEVKTAESIVGEASKEFYRWIQLVLQGKTAALHHKKEAHSNAPQLGS